MEGNGVKAGRRNRTKWAPAARSLTALLAAVTIVLSVVFVPVTAALAGEDDVAVQGDDMKVEPVAEVIAASSPQPGDDCDEGGACGEHGDDGNPGGSDESAGTPDEPAVETDDVAGAANQEVAKGKKGPHQPKDPNDHKGPNDRKDGNDPRDFKKGSLTIKKFDRETQKLLGGAVFKIERLANKQKGRWETVEEAFVVKNGIRTRNDLPAGKYRVTEVSAPKGYERDSEPRTVVIDPKNGKAHRTVTFYNTRKQPQDPPKPKGSLTIIKHDDHGNPLDGATFKVERRTSEDPETWETIREDVTTKDGSVTLNNLKPGTYRITEVSAPDGYEKDPEPKFATIGANDANDNDENDKEDHDKDGKGKGKDKDKGDNSRHKGKLHKTVTFVNHPKKDNGTPPSSSSTPRGNLRILKVDEKGNALDGATFRITGPRDYDVTRETKDGEIRLNGLRTGTYTVTEVSAPNGYTLEPKQVTVRVRRNATATVTIINTPEKPSDGDEPGDPGEPDKPATPREEERQDESPPVIEVKETKQPGPPDLPETGGNSMPFYAVGSLLMGAGLWLRRRLM